MNHATPLYRDRGPNAAANECHDRYILLCLSSTLSRYANLSHLIPRNLSKALVKIEILRSLRVWNRHGALDFRANIYRVWIHIILRKKASFSLDVLLVEIDIASILGQIQEAALGLQESISEKGYIDIDFKV